MIAIFQSCLLPKMRLSVVREGRFTGYKWTKISDLETTIFELDMMVKSGLVFFILEFY